MQAKNAKAILLIELMETGQPYDAAAVAQNYYAIVSANGGSHISTVDKKIVCALANPNVAAETACELMAFRVSGRSPFHPVARMCVCQITSAADAREAVAQAISTAARELVKAGAGQIVTTQETAENLSDQFEVRFGSSVGNAKVHVFEISKAESMDESTRVVTPADRSRAAQADSAGKQVHLRWRGKGEAKKEIVLHIGNPVVTFGREEGNDIVIESSTASRRHGRIEYANGNIYIVDESTNGTFVFPKTGEKFIVHKDRKPMPARGYFSLGEALGADHPAAIQFVAGFSVGG